MDALRTTLNDLFGVLRLADFFDILLVAFLLYVLLWWMRRSMSESARRGVGIVVAAFAGLYLPVRYFEMYLIGRAIEVLFALLLLVAIVVYQSDLRRMLDQAGTWVFTRQSSSDGGGSTVDLLVESVTHLAETYTGALIAIRGQEPWDHHVRGGVELDGEISPPLLYSIFDARTAGHDGAVLLEGKKITCFAAHLPLPENQPEESEYGGTRHSAAVGLSEVCDALVVVVSEEKGTISVAHEGKMATMDTAAELNERLNRFWRTHYEETTSGREVLWSWPSLQTAALSVVLSVSLWLIFVYSPEPIYRSYNVPIEYREVPSDWRLDDPPTTARITLSGPGHVFQSIDPTQLAVSMSLEEPQEGINRLRIDQESLELPEQLTLDSVDPRTVEVEAQPLTATVLPVSVPTKGAVSDSLLLDSVQPEPDSMTVLIPEGANYREVNTEPVHLDSIEQTTTLTRSIVPPEDMRLPEDASGDVEVQVTVLSKKKNSEDLGARLVRPRTGPLPLSGSAFSEAVRAPRLRTERR